MDISDYVKARKEGLKAYTTAVQKGEDPLMAVLEKKVPALNQLTRLPLGVHTIPLNDVVGTETQSRAFAFANNFMPILDASTEFASKWALLCESVKQDGVRQPVKALEYLGKYYLIEGNKRVSVSKYLHVDYLEADLTRVIPLRTEEPEIVAYFEYCEFHRLTGIREILFTIPGSYDRLINLTRHQKDEAWSSDDRRDMKTVFRYFRRCYEEMMTERKAMNVSDAFLRFLIAFGYEQLRALPESEVAEKARLMRAEFEIHEEAVNLIMDRESEAGGGFFSSLFAPSQVKAAFLYTRPPEESGWNYWHEIGRLNAEKVLGDKLETRACVVSSRTAFEETVEQLIRDKYQMIFATSPVMMNSCVRHSMEHPEVQMLCCSPLVGYQHVRSYYLRFFEAKFLLGVAAGVLSRGEDVGYIADYPIYGAASTVNAFACGVRMVSPGSRVRLTWTTRLDFNPADPFAGTGIRVICNRDINAPCHASKEYGLYVREKDGEILNMAALIPDWNSFYCSMIRRVLNGAKEEEAARGSAAGYWWGMSTGALKVVLSERFDPASARLVRHLQQGIEEGTLTPFAGELRDQAGNIRCAENHSLTPAEILCMDYLAENIVGGFPKLEELTETARPVVRLQGFDGEMRPDPAAIGWTFGAQDEE